MRQIRTKAELYQEADKLRLQLALPPFCKSEQAYARILEQPQIQVAFLSFQTPGLRGMCSPGQNGQEDIILLSNQLNSRERGFYAVHEWLHLCWHRSLGKSPFLCGEYRFPKQDSFLEWQANEGAAEIVMPWQQVLEFVQDANPDLENRSALIQLRLQLADQFGVSDQMASVRLESLRYEIACVLKGQPLHSIEPISAREQERRGIQVASLEEKAQSLFAEELEYRRRLRNIDVF